MNANAGVHGAICAWYCSQNQLENIDGYSLFVIW